MNKNKMNRNKLNKRAYILTLDALLASIIVLIVLGAAAAYMVRGENVMPNMQTARIGSDIVRLLENTGSLQTLDAVTIENDVNSLLPASYGMGLIVDWADADLAETGTFEIGDALPDKKFIGSGKRFFVVTNATSVINYGMAEYWIWLK